MNYTKNDKTILIGPTGFLGPAFLEKDSSIVAVGRRQPKHLNNGFFYIESDEHFYKLDDLDFQNVIFLIGCSDHHELNTRQTIAIEKNVLAIKRFLWYLQESNRKINKIINFTTMLQYDITKLKLPCNELQPRNPYINNYVLSKYVSELVTEQHRDLFNIIDVRISNVYGPTRLMRPDIVPSIVWSLIHNKSASVWTKKPKRDFIYVDDAVDAVMKLINTDFSGCVNLGTGIGSTVSDVCGHLEDVSGIHISNQNISVPGHMEYYQDISLLKSLIDWKPSYSLEDGIKKTYTMMNDYYHNNDEVRDSIQKSLNNKGV